MGSRTVTTVEEALDIAAREHGEKIMANRTLLDRARVKLAEQVGTRRAGGGIASNGMLAGELGVDIGSIYRWRRGAPIAKHFREKLEALAGAQEVARG